jgi:tetratricopeptide (TPR) repeat protein
MRLKIINYSMLLLLACLRLHASMPDSLRTELAGMPDSAQIKALIGKSVGEMYRSPELAERYLEYAAEVAERPENTAWFPKIVNQRGTLAWIKGDYPAALAQYQSAEKLFREAGNELGAAKAQNNIGLVYQDMAYYDLSLAAYLKSAAFFEVNGDKYALATLYNNIANVYNGNNDDARAQVYYDKSLLLFTELKDTNGISMCHSNLGLVLEGLGRAEESRQHFEAAIAGYEALDYPVGIAKVLNNLSTYYANKSQFEQAESLCLKALSLAEKAQSGSEISISQLKLSEIYVKWGRYPDALAMARASLASGAGGTALLQTASSHEVLAATFEKMGRYDSAYVHLQLQTAFKDSIFNQGKARAIEEMRAKFNIELKDKELENLIQKQRIDSLWKWGLGILLVLLLVLGTVIYTRQRAIIRREQALQAKDREMHQAQKARDEAELKAQSAELQAKESNLKATEAELKVAALGLQATEAELRAAESERLRLSEEISFKSREISGLAMNIVRRNDLLEVLDRELKVLRKGADEQKLKELSILVSQTLSLENERKEFQLYIQEAQQNFFRKLEAAFPDLSAKEKRLCAMIVLGLSSKEIAAVFNIAGSSVEVARHRLRKKLNLDPNAGLKEFLETF